MEKTKGRGRWGDEMRDRKQWKGRGYQRWKCGIGTRVKESKESRNVMQILKWVYGEMMKGRGTGKNQAAAGNAVFGP